ncbi:MAG: DUF2087 domain-containing protein [Burkholderiales bacterium]|nr:DUF2087 domain-containing protein [Burkholderiales bacterium]
MNQIFARLSSLVVKDHVSLGNLPAAEQALALAIAHARLPAAAALGEREVNEVLKAALAGPLCWLDTDHVELRRWLVDAGWVVRDGFGREYRARPHAALPAASQPLARALATVDIVRWVAAEREQRERSRAERKTRWQAGAAAG